MPTPTDALALFRTVLANPADETPRLVFADWLEETNERHNIAWAEYLRANTASYGDSSDGHMLHDLAGQIRATVTLPARIVAYNQEVLFKLLPAKNIVAKLPGYFPPHFMRSVIVESVARDYHVVPLYPCGHLGFLELHTYQYLVATAEPENIAVLHELVNRVGCAIVALKARDAEIDPAIDDIYSRRVYSLAELMRLNATKSDDT